MKTRLLTYKHNLNFCCIIIPKPKSTSNIGQLNYRRFTELQNSSLPNGNLQISEMSFETTHGKPNLKLK